MPPLDQPAQKPTQVWSPISRGPPKAPYIHILVYARCGCVGMPILRQCFIQGESQRTDDPADGLKYPARDRYADDGGRVVVALVGGGGHRTANEASQPDVRAAKFASMSSKARLSNAAANARLI